MQMLVLLTVFLRGAALMEVSVVVYSNRVATCLVTFHVDNRERRLRMLLSVPHHLL